MLFGTQCSTRSWKAGRTGPILPPPGLGLPSTQEVIPMVTISPLCQASDSQPSDSGSDSGVVTPNRPSDFLTFPSTRHILRTTDEWHTWASYCWERACANYDADPTGLFADDWRAMIMAFEELCDALSRNTLVSIFKHASATQPTLQEMEAWFGPP